jgi:hypothetical protein
MTARSLIAGLTLALTAISCSDKGPTEANNLSDTQNAPSTAQAARGPLVIPNVSGTQTDGGTFTGTLTITQITRDAAGNLSATGTLTGVSSTLGTITRSFTTSLDISQATRTCRILHLDVGPIALDLLGLQVNLSRIVLDITAVAGSGNLLGNLLCAVAHLLDQNPINLTALDQLLQQINAILSGL